MLTQSHTPKVINFMKWKYPATWISILFLFIAITSITIKGINFGLDFTGGLLIEARYDRPADIDNIRDELGKLGFNDAIVQEFGAIEDVLIRISSGDTSVGTRVAEYLESVHEGTIEIKRIEFVGPQVGEHLKEQGGIGMLIAVIVVMAYVAFRFQLKFSMGAVAALVHDTIIVLGIFSLFQLQFDLTVLAAILAIIGYSLNDTIIVYDRIRENFRIMHDADSLEVINRSLTQTLGRTLATSGTTMMVLTSLFLFGGDMIHNFSLALLLGIGVGTYSSIYISSCALLFMKTTKYDLISLPEEEEFFDEETKS